MQAILTWTLFQVSNVKVELSFNRKFGSVHSLKVSKRMDLNKVPSFCPAILAEHNSARKKIDPDSDPDPDPEVGIAIGIGIEKKDREIAYDTRKMILRISLNMRLQR